jgi:hypothetical protein
MAKEAGGDSEFEDKVNVNFIRKDHFEEVIFDFMM